MFTTAPQKTRQSKKMCHCEPAPQRWRGNPFLFFSKYADMTTKTYYVYILASSTNYTIYTGVTNDLIRRVYEHRHSADPGSFTSKYKVHKLVYFEDTTDIYAAIEREKQIKGWNRKRKNELIESQNPSWNDLYPEITE